MEILAALSLSCFLCSLLFCQLSENYESTYSGKKLLNKELGFNSLKELINYYLNVSRVWNLARIRHPSTEECRIFIAMKC